MATCATFQPRGQIGMRIIFELGLNGEFIQMVRSTLDELEQTLCVFRFYSLIYMYTIFFARLVIDIVQTPWKSACAHERKHANNTHHLSAAFIHRALYTRSMRTHAECQKLCTDDGARTVAANKPSADAHNSFSERRASVRVQCFALSSLVVVVVFAVSAEKLGCGRTTDYRTHARTCCVRARRCRYASRHRRRGRRRCRPTS